MAKLIQVSPNNVDWYTLPGSTGDWSESGTQVEDTIYGQSFQSNDVGVISATLNANAYYKGFVGYKATIKSAGTPTAFTGEAMTLVSGKRYRINNLLRTPWDRNTAIVVKDNGVDRTNRVVAIDFLWGEIEFDATYTVTGPVTVDGAYMPLANLGRARGFTLTQTAEPIDTSDYPTLQANGGVMTYDPGLRTVSLELPGVYDPSSNLSSFLTNGTELLIEINPDGQNKSRARGFFRAINRSQSGAVGNLEEETVSFSLNVPDKSANTIAPEKPFAWLHSSGTPLNIAIRTIINAWETETKPFVKYLWDGTSGYSARAVVQDVSLNSSTTGMNEFTANFQIDGNITQI